MSIHEMRTVTYPYPGLRTFETDEAEIFFGREEHVDDLLVRLQRRRFLGVVGPSGCGKSSLVRAGMIPALQGGLVASAGSGWQVAVMRPGTQPLKSLAQALRDSAGPSATDEDGFLDAVLGRGALGLVEALEEYGFAGENNLLLVVDQFEELFRFSTHGASSEARAFVDLLLTSAQAEPSRQESPVYVVVTMRSDFLGHCPVFRGLPEALNDSQYLTPRLNREQQRAAIEGPAAVFNTAIRPEVVNRILNEMGTDPDQLPLMQHLLMRMWRTERRKARDQGQPMELTGETYREVGGLHGCLSSHAEQTYQLLRGQEPRIAELLFRQLAEVNPDSRLVRRPRRYGALCGLLAPVEESRERVALRNVIEAFRHPGRCFLMPPSGEALAYDALIDISHESLVRQWDRLKNWVQEEHKLTRISRIVAEKTARWKEAGEPQDYLLYGVELAEAKAWRDKYSDQLGPDEERLLAESIKHAEEEVRREEALKYAKKLEQEEVRRKEALRYSSELEKRNRLLKFLLLFAAALAVLAVCLGIGASRSAKRADENEKIARGKATEAEEQAHRAEKLLARNYAENGVRQMDDGKTEEALVWFSEALARDEHVDPARVEMHRLRLGALLQQCSKLVWMLPHDGPVNVAEFSSDGRRAVTASVDGTARVWDVATGQQLASLTHNSPSAGTTSIRHASFSRPDGRLVVTAGTDNTAVVWDAEKGEKVTTVHHAGPVRRAAFSLDGSRIVTASADRTAGVWEARTGKPLCKKLVHEGLVYLVAFSPDGSRVVTACADKGKSVCVWDVATGNPVTKPLSNSDYVVAAAFSPWGDRIATAAKDGAVKVLDVKNDNLLRHLSLDPIEFRDSSLTRVAFAAKDGTRVLTVGSSGPQLWEVGTGKKVPLPAKAYWENNPTFSPDGRLRLSWSSHDHAARIRDEATGKPRWAAQGQSELRSAGFYGSDRVLITVGEDNIVRVGDPRTGKSRSPLANEQEIVNRALLSPNLQLILTIYKDNTSRLWDARTGKPVTGPMRDVKDAAFSPNSQRLVTASDNGRMRTWDTATGATLAEFRGHRAEPFHAVFDRTSELVVSCVHDNVAYIWQAATGKTIRPLPHNSSWVRYASFSPDGRWLITTSFDKTGRIWDLSTDQAPPLTLNHDGTVVSASFSEDGSRVVTASEDKTARVWDTVSGKAIAPPLRHKDFVSQASFSPDGLRVLTRTDYDARVWDVTTGEPLTPWLKQAGLKDAVFAPDGFGVVTVGSDGTSHSWDFPRETRPTEDLVQLAQLLSGYRVHPDQGLMPCLPGTLLERWQALRLKYPGDFRCSLEIPTAWHQQEAHEAEQTSQWKVARLHLDALLTADPGEGSFHFRRAQASSEMGQWKEAIPDYSLSLPAKTDAEVWFRRGRAHARLGRLDQALADYHKALELNPTDGALWLARSLVNVQLRHPETAQEDYEKALLRSPVNLPRDDCWWNDRGRNRKPLDQAHWQAVRADCEAAITAGKATWGVWRSRGLAHSSIGAWAQAANDFSNAADLAPEDWHSWQGAARAFAETDNWVKAEQASHQAIRLDKRGDWGCCYLLGMACSRRSQYPEAIAAFSEAAKRGGKGWGILAQRSYVYALSKDYDRAIKDYTEVIRVHPHGTVYNNRANAHKNKGDYGKALVDYSEAIRLSPRAAHIHKNLGDLYRRTEDYEKALAEYDNAIDLNPKYAAAFAGRGDVYYSRGSYEKALLEYTKALEHSSNYVYAYAQLGRAYGALLDHDRAILNYSEAIRLLPDNASNSNNRASYYNGLGYAHQKKGERKTAIEDYLEALRADPTMMAATVNLAKLMIKEGQARQVDDLLRDMLAGKEKLARDNPFNSNHRGDLAWGYQNQALLFQLTGRLPEAELACRHALDVLQKLATEDPKNRFRRVNLASCYEQLGSILREAKKPSDEEKAYREALSLHERLVADFDNSAECYNGLAWILCTCPAERLRDTGKAVQCARRAVDLAPSVGNYWNTLGVADYRAGKWKEAVEELKKSIALTSEGGVVDWLFLAMAHKQLGDHQEAQRWYGRAARDLDRDQVMDQSRRLFRAEASALLGLTARAAKEKR
jgi:WD40 repeat protein/tetratricopeptide (TPR) repeat protein